MVGLKLTDWALGYEVKFSSFSKLAVFTKLRHILSDKCQVFNTFQGSILILAPWPGAFDIFYPGHLMKNMFGTMLEISLGKLSDQGNEL